MLDAVSELSVAQALLAAAAAIRGRICAVQTQLIVPLHGVPQFDIRRVRDNGFVISGILGAVAAGPKDARAAEKFEEKTLELATEDDVNDEVDATVDSDQEVAHLDHPRGGQGTPRARVESFINVGH